MKRLMFILLLTGCSGPSFTSSETALVAAGGAAGEVNNVQNEAGRANSESSGGATVIQNGSSGTTSKGGSEPIDVADGGEAGETGSQCSSVTDCKAVGVPFVGDGWIVKVNDSGECVCTCAYVIDVGNPVTAVECDK